MKRLIAGALVLLSTLTFGATLNSISLLNPAGSTAGQAITSTGPSTPPAWSTITLDGIGGFSATGFVYRNSANSYVIITPPIPVAAGGTGVATAAAELARIGAAPLASPVLTTPSAAASPARGNASNLLATTFFIQDAFGNPPPIGTGTPAAGSFTTLNASGNDALFYQNSSGQIVPNSTNTTVTNWTKVSDRINTNFNALTGTFTAPATGDYLVTATLEFVSAAGAIGNVVQVIIVANGVAIAVGTTEIQSTTAINMPCTISAIAHLTSGQNVVIQASQNIGIARALLSTAVVNTLLINRIP